MTIRLTHLEIHASHGCNLTCESCNHFSNGGHKGFVPLDEADEWMKSWNRRIVPKYFRILGGEATLNSRLSEWIALAARNWPQSRIGLTTNGFLLHRHPELPRLLEKHNGVLCLTVHDLSEPYLVKTRETIALIKEWRKRHSFEFTIAEAYKDWTRRHHGFGAHVLPYDDGDPRSSWENCPSKLCCQLFRDRLWKCSSIAYLPLQKETYPDLSARWDPYLSYQGLAPGCSDGQLRAFLRREDESICGMCPAKPERFDKPSPLIPLGVLRKASGCADPSSASELVQSDFRGSVGLPSVQQGRQSPIRKLLAKRMRFLLGQVRKHLPLYRIARALARRLGSLLRWPFFKRVATQPLEDRLRGLLAKLGTDMEGLQQLPGNDACATQRRIA